MTRFANRLAALAMFGVTLILAPALVPALAAGGGGGGADPGPNPPVQQPPESRPAAAPHSKSSHKARKSQKQTSVDEQKIVEGYRAAHATIYDRHDYAGAIEQLKALGQDDRPNVANLIGYSYRKLGDYGLSQIWYERALKADPNHLLTWQYYGLWQVEQGNRDQALYHLGRIAAICGTGCEHYRSLAAALEKPPGSGLVY
jgi:tetratricopeptide (TPR) repeat protein